MTKGEELLASLNGVRNFLNDLGQLLVTGDTLMAEHSWESFGGNGCHQGSSGSALEGRKWLPPVLFRRYYNGNDYPNVAAMISILLDDSDFELTEPLICGAYFVFPEDVEEEDVWLDGWNAGWAGWRADTYDGTPVTVGDDDEHWREKWGWRCMQAFARPLVEVTSQTILKELVVDPLLALVDAHVSTPADAATPRKKRK